MGSLMCNFCYLCQDEYYYYQNVRKNEILSIIENENFEIIQKPKREIMLDISNENQKKENLFTSDLSSKENTANIIEKKLYGFYNPGNDCFMNASLQLLTHIDELTLFIKKCCEGEENNQLKNKYYDIIKLIEEGNDEKIINGESIKEEIGNLDERFQTNEQQDASEFISFFLKKLLEETQGTKDINNFEDESKKLNEFEKEGFTRLWKRFFLKKGKSFIVDLFYGILKVETKNKSDDKLISVRFNMFNILELPIYYLAKESNSNILDMDIILLSFFNKPKENDDGKTYDITTIYKLPKYLLIFFNKTVDKNYLNIEITYKQDIDMKNYLSLNQYINNKMSSYSLESIITYIGNSKSGHYTSICKISNENWYSFNDSSYKINKNKYKNNDAIILLYKMKG